MIKATNENVLKLNPGDFYISYISKDAFCKWKVLKTYWVDNEFYIDVITFQKNEESPEFWEYEIGEVIEGFIISLIDFSSYSDIYIEFSLKKRINKLLEI